MTMNALGYEQVWGYFKPDFSPQVGEAPSFDRENANCDGIKVARRGHTTVDEQAFQQIVDATYESLYRFALSLTHGEADACDLTQEAFRRLAERGDQIRDASKVKTWLFTTLYRRFITLWRRENKFPHFELSVVAPDLPVAPPPAGEALDAATVRAALNKLDDLYRLPLLLFYLEDHTYAEIAEILQIPCGTVMSRIARGRQQLREQLCDRNGALIFNVS